MNNVIAVLNSFMQRFRFSGAKQNEHATNYFPDVSIESFKLASY